MTRRLVLAAAGVTAALALATAWLLTTESGLNFVLGRVLPLLPVSVEVQSAEGRLAGPLRLGRFELTAPTVRITARNLDADWSPLALAAGKIRVVELKADALEIELRTAPEPGPSEPDAGPGKSAPPVRVDDLLVRQLQVSGQDRVWLSGARLAAAGSLSGSGLDLERLDLTSEEGALRGHARISAQDDLPWSVALQWRIGPGGDAGLTGRTRIDGPRSRLQVEQSLSGALDGAISGQLSLAGDDPSADLALYLEPVTGGAGLVPAILDGLEADLALEGSRADARLAGRLRWPALASGDIALDASARWRRGGLLLRPLRLAFANGGEARIEGLLTPGERWALDADLSGTDLGWPLGEPTPVAPVPQVALSIRGDAAEYRLQLDGRAGYAGFPVSALTAAGRMSGSQLIVDALTLTQPENGVSATGTGTLDFGEGNFRYRFRAGGEARGGALPAFSASLAGRGDTSAVELEKLTGHILGGVVEGSGRLAWGPGAGSSFVATVTDLDPAVLVPDYPGRVSARLTVTGGLQSQNGLALDLEEVSGSLRDRALSGEGRLVLTDGEIRADPLRLEIGSARISVLGRAGDILDLSASLSAPELDDVLAGGGGELNARISVSGRREAFLLEGSVEGQGLRYADQAADVLRAGVRLDTSWKTPSRLTVDARGLPGPGEEPMDASLEADGLRDNHRMTLVLVRGDQRVRANLQGALPEAGWRGVVASLALEYQQDVIWQLQAPAGLSLSRDSARLDEACFDGEPGRACLQGTWTRAQGLSAGVSLDELRLKPLTDWAGMAYLATGSVSGTARLETDGSGYRELSGRLSLGEGSLVERNAEEDPVYSWRGGTLLLEGDRQVATARLVLRLSGEERLEGSATVGWNDSPQPLSGRLEAEVNALPVLAEFFPDLSNPTGRTTVLASLGGTIQRPELSGSLLLEEGGTGIPALGIQLTQVQGKATLDGTLVEITLEASSGSGALEMEGWVDLAADASPVSRFWLRGTDVLLVDIPEARLIASPDLKFTYRYGEMRIVGNVAIPSGKLTGILATGAVNPSPDEVIVGEAPDEGAAVIARIYVQVGPNVDVELRGLSGRLEGEMLTVVDPPALPWGRGELRFIDGELAAFGQELEIQRGKLIYNNVPLQEPALDVVARREVDGVTAGARVRGPLSEPSFSIFSDPPMSRAETLSYLTTGKPVGDLDSGEDAALSRAAASLALAGGSLIAGEVGERVGIDTLGFEGDDETGNASLVIGKYLSPQLFVSYGVGLLDAINVLKMRYRLNRRLSVEVATSDETSADIIYTFDRE